MAHRSILKPWWSPVTWTEGSQKVEGNGCHMLSYIIYTLKYISQGLCHHRWLWILFVPVLWYKKSAGVCQQDRFYTLEMRERDRDRERSFILSMPPHQHSDHIAFISDLATILCLHPFFLFWFVSLHPWKQNFLLCLWCFRKCYSRTAFCPIRKIVASEKKWHFKIKQGKTTHWNGSYIFSSRSFQQSYTGVFF